MGIGTTGVPSAKLDVLGDATFCDYTNNSTGKLIIRGPNSPGDINSKRDISYEFNAAGKAKIRSYRGGAWDTYLQFMTSNATNTGGEPVVSMHIDAGGNVGIGTTTPGNKLEVNGTIRAKEIKVELANWPTWPDFVFTPTYTPITCRG